MADFPGVRGAARALPGLACVFLAPAATLLSAAPFKVEQGPLGATSYVRLADEMEDHLRQGVLRSWFPKCVDHENGGFRPSYLNDGSPGTENEKTIVFQSRMTWVAAQIVMRRPDLADEFRPYVRHGMCCLTDMMWDKEFGGPFWQLTPSGQVHAGKSETKHAYGIAFCIYAASAAHQATGSDEDLRFAQMVFRWFDKHAHDAVNGGYHEALERDGKPILSRPPEAKGDRGLIGAPHGFKSMNAHLHILEALISLHEIWPDPLVKARLNEVFEILRDRIATPPGLLRQFFKPDWSPVPGVDSFGHDVEAAYLLLEAQEQLERGDGERTLAVARSLVDNPLRKGWDGALGGFFDTGSESGELHSRDKIWWTQAEGLNALLLMHRHFGAETPKYYDAFLKQWAFIWNHQIDHIHGEWFGTVSPAGEPNRALPKGSYWKAAYHNGRALLNVIDALRRMAASDERDSGVRP